MFYEGDLCPNCGEDHLALPRVENCSCHISPPCPACTDASPYCPTCGFAPDEWYEGD
jgi:hypothetical protein